MVRLHGTPPRALRPSSDGTEAGFTHSRHPGSLSPPRTRRTDEANRPHPDRHDRRAPHHLPGDADSPARARASARREAPAEARQGELAPAARARPNCAGAPSSGRRTGTARPSPGSASGGRRACRPRPPSRSRRTASTIRHSAMFLRSVGLRVPDVMTPICERPPFSWTQSPWPAVSLPASSSPTSVRCGCALRSISASLPTKSSSMSRFDREADAGLERVDLVVELVAREDQPRLDPQHVERVEPERLSGPCGAPAAMTASHTASPSSGWQKIS